MVFYLLMRENKKPVQSLAVDAAQATPVPVILSLVKSSAASAEGSEAD